MSSRRPPSPEPEVEEELNATQFEPGGDSDRELWAAITILDERQRKRRGRTIGEYLVDWEGTDPKTGNPWIPSWEPKKDCTDVLIQEWKAKKKADPGIEGRYTKEQEALKKAARNSARRKSSSRARTTTPKQRDNTVTVSPSVSIERGKAEKRKRSTTVDEDEDQKPKQLATRTRRSSGSAAIGSGDDSPQKPPATKRQRSVAPSSATSGPSKTRNQADSSRKTSRSRVKSAAVVPDSENEDEVPPTPSNGDPDSLEDRLQLQNPQGKVDKGKGREVAGPIDPEPNVSKSNLRVYGKSRVRRRKSPVESAPRDSALRQEVFVELSDDIEEAGSDAEVFSVKGLRSVSVDSQDKSLPAESDLEEDFPKRTARILGEKHVAFVATQESEESVVPGTFSTDRQSQDSQVSETEARTGPEGSDGDAQNSLQSGIEASDDGAEVASQQAFSQVSHDIALVSALEVESTRTALEEVMQSRDETIRIEETSTVDATVTILNTEPEPALFDGVVPASQTDLFQTAVELMAEYGFEGDESMSQPSKSDREDVLSPAEQLQPSTPEEARHPSGPAEADFAGLADSQDHLRSTSRSTTPVQQAIRLPAHLSPAPLRTFEMSASSVLQHLSYTQETIEQFSSPVRGPLPRASSRPANEFASPVRTQRDDFELVSPPRSAADQAATVKQQMEGVVSPPSANPAMNSGSHLDEAQLGFGQDTVAPEGPASSATPTDHSAPDAEPSVSTKVQDETPLQAPNDMVVEASDARMLGLQARVQELEALVSQQDGKLSTNRKKLKAAQAATKSLEEEYVFFRGLFDDASSKAGDFARENAALESKNASLKEQLDMGLRQQKLHYEAVNRRADEEIRKLEHQLAFLLAQNRATGDSVRHRASQYPKLQKKHQRLVEAHMELQRELRITKKTNRKLQSDLDMLGPSDDSDEPCDSDQDIETYPGPADLQARGYAVQPRGHDVMTLVTEPDLIGETMTVVMPAPPPVEDESPNYREFVHADRPDIEEPVPATTTIEKPDLPQQDAADESSSLTVDGKQKETLLGFLESALAASNLPLHLRVDVVQSGHRKVTETTHVFPYTDVRYKTLESRILVTVTGQAAEIGQIENAPVMLSALEARIYTLPSKSTTIVYISKVDSSGYSALPAQYKPPAITSCLTRSFLRYFVSSKTRPTPRVFCHLFARAQKQYLFANSSDGGEKKVLSGLGLCKWWRNLFERVAIEIQTEDQADNQGADFANRIQLQCWLPGTEPEEAKNMLGSTSNAPSANLDWSYNPPFGSKQATPLYNPEETVRQLAYLIPRFEDDPKARYLDELVISRAGKASVALRREGADKETETQASTERTSKALHQKKKDDQARLRQEAALSLQSIKPSDFWATLAGRQDCNPGDQTGFIGMALVPAQSADMPSVDAAILEQHLTSLPGLNPKILDRLVTAMLNHDFGTRKYALTATSRFLNEIERIVSAEVGASERGQRYTATVKSQGVPVLKVASASSVSQASLPVNFLQPIRKKKKVTPVPSAPASQSPFPIYDSGPPTEVFQCHWRNQEGASEKCSSLFENLEALEHHAVSHMLS